MQIRGFPRSRSSLPGEIRTLAGPLALRLGLSEQFTAPEGPRRGGELAIPVGMAGYSLGVCYRDYSAPDDLNDDPGARDLLGMVGKPNSISSKQW